jgi:F-type H+-transporting ATPase subunit epsilon
VKLKIILPWKVLLEQEVAKVVAEAQNGSFCLLPRHIDFVASLVPGVLAFTPAEGGEEFLAVDEGTLVKCGPEVLVSTRNAVRGPALGELRKAVEEQFGTLTQREEQARSALNRLEASMVYQVVAWGEGGRG